ETGMKKKRTEITIETESMLFINSPNRALTWCAACRAEVEMVTLDQAAILAGVDTRTIFRRLESDNLHSSETAAGLLLICLASLSSAPQQESSSQQIIEAIQKEDKK